jgi:prepilin-type N-terminal cleavage/methylation domain-containing protein
MRIRTRPAHKGFTLVEIVAAIVLFGIIGAMVSRVISQSFNSYVIGRNVAETDWQARVAVERMTRELRTIRSPADITINSASDLSFVDADGTTIRYCAGAVGGCPGTAGDLMRNSQVLATGVSALNISYLTKTAVVTATPAQVYYVVVTFTATQGNISKNYQIAVSPRNFP